MKQSCSSKRVRISGSTEGRTRRGRRAARRRLRSRRPAPRSLTQRKSQACVRASARHAICDARTWFKGCCTRLLARACLNPATSKRLLLARGPPRRAAKTEFCLGRSSWRRVFEDRLPRPNRRPRLHLRSCLSLRHDNRRRRMLPFCSLHFGRFLR